MSSKTMKVLVVDDQEEMREVIGLSLKEIGGCRVVFAEPGPEVIARAESEQPDVILLDAKMPGMDGPTTFQRLLDNPRTRHIPVVLLTASVQKAELQTFARFGFAAILEKPFDPLLLTERIKAAIGWQEDSQPQG